MLVVTTMTRIKKLKAICKRYDIDLVYLFGSRSGEALHHLNGGKVSINDPLADIDIGIVFRTGLPPAEDRYNLYADIYNNLSDLFEPLLVDLSSLQENHSVFQLEAVLGRCAYYGDISYKDNYEEMILRRAADFRPILDLFLNEALEEI